MVGAASQRRWLGADPKPRRRRAWVWVTAVTGAERRIGQPRGINWAQSRRVGELGGVGGLSLRGDSARMDACADKAQLGSGPMRAAGWRLALA